MNQSQQATSSKNEISLQVPVALSQAAAQAKVDVLLAETWVGRESAQFTLPPSFEWVEPGDVLEIAGNCWRVKNIMAGSARKVEALAHDAAVYISAEVAERQQSQAAPAIFGPAHVLALDLAMVGLGGAAGLRFAAQSTPWPGSLALYRQSGTGAMQFNRSLGQRSTMGQTLTALNAGLTTREDFTQSLDVKLDFGALASIAHEQLLDGANAAAIGTEATGFEIIQFEQAELIAPMTYRLRGILRAQAGSEPEMLATRLVGQEFVLLNSAVVQTPMNDAQAGLSALWRIGPAQRDYGHASFVPISTPGALKSFRPLSPTYLQMRKMGSNYELTWIRRTRIDGDGWELAEVPLGEATEVYRLEIVGGGVVKRSVDVPLPSYTYSNSNLIADFGGVAPTNFIVRVAQISSSFGPGAFAERTFNA